MAWRWYTPLELHGVLTLNLIGFLPLATPIYITIQQLEQLHHVISFIDSSSDLGWIHKASFDPVDEKPQDMMSRFLLWTTVRNEVYLNSQHIKGLKNIIADSLSRDLHRSDIYLTTIFKSILPLHLRRHYTSNHFPEILPHAYC